MKHLKNKKEITFVLVAVYKVYAKMIFVCVF